MTILLLLELGIADRVAVDYAEFLTYKILATDVTACAPLLLPVLSASPSALASLLQSTNSGLHCLKTSLNKILCRTFSKSVCKEKSIKPNSVCLKHKDAGVKEISFLSELHLQPFFETPSKINQILLATAIAELCKQQRSPRRVCTRAGETQRETGISPPALCGCRGAAVKALCPWPLCPGAPSPSARPTFPAPAPGGRSHGRPSRTVPGAPREQEQVPARALPARRPRGRPGCTRP